MIQRPATSSLFFHSNVISLALSTSVDRDKKTSETGIVVGPQILTSIVSSKDTIIKDKDISFNLPMRSGVNSFISYCPIAPKEGNVLGVYVSM